MCNRYWEIGKKWEGERRGEEERKESKRKRIEGKI